MQKTLQEQVVARVYELLPEKKELEFGCEIVVAGMDNINPGTGRDVVVHGTQSQRELGFIPTEYYGQVHRNDIAEIIGQPLGAVELLLAMKKAGYPMGHYYIQEILGMDTFENSKRKYNLQDDNLLNQSNELCELCLGLLNK